MDWLYKMNLALDYIEAHLSEETDYHRVAQLACCSPFHFQRMFSFITEVPLSEYIRRRRLTLAAFALQNSDVKIIDLALEFGYESPEAFSRAFHKLHGVTPSIARAKGTALKAYPRISFHISIKGATEMNYRIEEKPAFELCGLSKRVSTVDGENLIEIPQFIRQTYQSGAADRLHQVLSLAPDVCLHGACYDFSEDGFSYMICYDAPSSGTPAGYDSLPIPALTWAVFSTPEEHPESQITEQIQRLWSRIYPEWFPTSGYEHAEGPELEHYDHKGNGKFISEVWIPVTRSAVPQTPRL